MSNVSLYVGSLASIPTRDHDLLTGLTDDDHIQYALLAGRTSPQTLAFGSASGAATGYLSSTSHATKGKYFLNAAGTLTVDEANLRVGIGTASPVALLDARTTRASGADAIGLVLSDPVTGSQSVGFGNVIRWYSNNGGSLAEIMLGVGGDGTNNQSEIRFRTQISAGNLVDKWKISDVGYFVAMASNIYLDLSTISAGSPNLKITATSDTPTVAFTGGGNAPTTAPAGYLEILVGASARYIPFWA